MSEGATEPRGSVWSARSLLPLWRVGRQRCPLRGSTPATQKVEMLPPRPLERSNRTDLTLSHGHGTLIPSSASQFSLCSVGTLRGSPQRSIGLHNPCPAKH